MLDLHSMSPEQSPKHCFRKSVSFGAEWAEKTLSPNPDTWDATDDDEDDKNKDDDSDTLSICQQFGTFVDLKSADMFQKEFIELAKDTKHLQRRVTRLLRSGSVASDSDDGHKEGLHKTISTIHRTHVELICKKDAQIELMSRREKYLIDKYEKAIADKDQELKEAQEAYHTLETTAISQAVDEALSVVAKKTVALRTPLVVMQTAVKKLRKQTDDILATMKQQQRIFSLQSYKFGCDVFKMIENRDPPTDVMATLSAIGTLPPSMRVTDSGRGRFARLSALLGLSNVHIDDVLEQAVRYIEEHQASLQSRKADSLIQSLRVPNPAARVNSMITNRTVSVTSTGTQCVLGESLGDSKNVSDDRITLLLKEVTHSNNSALNRSMDLDALRSASTLEDKVVAVTQALQSTNVFVPEPQRDVLKSAMETAKQLSHRSAALTMRSIVQSVRERRQMQLLQDLYGVGPDGCPRQIANYVYCHTCGKGPYPLQRTWRCDNCFSRLVRPPLPILSLDNKKKPAPAPQEDKYAYFFRQIEARRARREEELAQARKRIQAERERVMQHIIEVLHFLGPHRKISTTPKDPPMLKNITIDSPTTTTKIPTRSIPPPSRLTALRGRGGISTPLPILGSQAQQPRRSISMEIMQLRKSTAGMGFEGMPSMIVGQRMTPLRGKVR